MNRIHEWSDWPAEVQAAAARAAAEGSSVGPIRCPACGGKSRSSSAVEDSLSVWVDGAFYCAHCWRASCDYHARVPLNPGVVIGKPKFRPKYYEGALHNLDAGSEVATIMARQYGLTLETLDSCGAKDASTTAGPYIYMPVYGPETKQERGSVVRRLYFRPDRPKVMTYKATDSPLLGWHPREGKPIIVVEDLISAMRLWQADRTGVALLGTELSAAKAAELYIHQGPDRPCYLCLDADATSKAIAYARKYPWLHVRRLTQDIKDMSTPELHAFLTASLWSIHG